MPTESELQRQLKAVNWDFEGALSSYGIHRLHWYPSTFIPQIPAYLIELLSSQGEVVYDPFCGVGTTLVEALRLGRRAIGTDVNPVAVRVAKAKTTFLEPRQLRTQYRALKARTLAATVPPDGIAGHSLFGVEEEPNDAEDETASARLLRPWYHESTWRQMRALKRVIDRERSPIHDLALVVFSAISKTASSQREHWGYVADNMVPKTHVYVDAVKVFLDELADAVESLNRFQDNPLNASTTAAELSGRATVVRANLLEGTPVEPRSVDLIVTSPPYPNVTDTARSQRLSFWWLGEDLEGVREWEIGARFKRKRKSAVESYVEEMRSCLRTIAPTLKPNRYLCLVVAESEASRKQIALIEVLRETVKTMGFVEPFAKICRRTSRHRLLSRSGSPNEEEILIFRKV